MNHNPMHASNRNEWETPDWLFARVNGIYSLSIDVCALPKNAKLPRYWSPADDGLAQDWSAERCWMNPPYGKQIAAWCKKAADESANGAFVVALLPARTETRWWFDYVLRARLIRFLKGRLRFGDMTTNAPFPNALIVWEGVGASRMPSVQWRDMRNEPEGKEEGDS